MTETNEANLTECRACKKHVMRILDGTYDGYNKRWINALGVAWNGRVCPDCHRNKIRENAATKRATREDQRTD